MAFENGDCLARGNVPESDGLVLTPRGQCLAIGRERYANDRVGVALENGSLLARANVPQSHAAIPASRRKCLAVRREGNGHDIAVMPLESRPFLQLLRPD